MSWTTVFHLATAILASLGGAGAIVLAFSKQIGRMWADIALEKERHKYAEMLQTAKSELDNTAKRYQAQLDSLSFVHNLRTTEEFSKLGQLWRQMALLRASLTVSAGLGFKIMPADREEAARYAAQLRTDYETRLREAQKFFLEEKLFVPKNIADCAESTLGASLQESALYSIWANDREAEVRRMYAQELPKLLKQFEDGMIQLEGLMRNYIEGARIANLPID